MTALLPRSTINIKIAAKLDFQKDANYKGQGKKGGWTLDFHLTGNPHSWRPSCHHCSQTRVVFPSFKLFRTPQLSGRKCQNQNGGNVNICLIFWFWKQCWETSSDSHKSSNREFVSNSLKEFTHLRVFRLWFCIMHGLGHGSNDTWLIW